MSSSSPAFSIGDIVALKSNPFFAELNDVIMSGESDSVSPLMVVIETMTESQDKYNDKTGATEGVKGRKNCKCLWYSHKTWQFEEAWLPDTFLKAIACYSTETKEESIWSPGTLVSLSTLKLERKKRKSFLKHDGHDFEDKHRRNTIHHVLSFMCPVMHVMDTRKNDNDEQSFDIKKGTPRKSFPTKLVKCKWFNHGTEKMSERLLPIEALNVITQPNKEFLGEIDTIIKEENFIKIPSATELDKIIKPLSITYNSGEYWLRGYDYLLNRITENELPFEKYETLTKPEVVLATAPKFGFIEDPFDFNTVTDEIENFVNESHKNKNYIRLNYLGKFKSSWYTISNYAIRRVSEDENYLIGLCVALGEDRTFRLDRIQKLECLCLVEEEEKEE